MNKFNLKKGLSIPIAGVPKQIIEETKIPHSVAILGTDYNGLKPKMFVNVGDKVERGTPLFCHKDNPDVPFVSPCKGFVKSTINFIQHYHSILRNVNIKFQF